MQRNARACRAHLDAIPHHQERSKTLAKINLENTVFETSIKDGDGNPHTISIDFAKMDETYLEAHLRKAVQRFLNDKYSQLKADDKLVAIKDEAARINSGAALERKERVSVAPADPVEALAVKNAKGDLLAAFKARTGAGKIADMIAADAAVARFFTDNGVWRDDVVLAWMESKAKRDYRADAKATLDAASDLDLG